MHLRLITLVLALAAAGFAAAQRAPSAPPSPSLPADCRKALDELQLQESAVARSGQGRGQREAGERPVVPATLQAARRKAARACLGGPGPAEAPPGRTASPPVGVAPVTVPSPTRPDAAAPVAVAPPEAGAPQTRAVPPPATALPARPSPPPPVDLGDRPPTLTMCDTIGCWASDGTRLQWVGPNLQGPRGLCSVVGTQLHCP